MREWERKPNADKTWVHLQSFFGDLYTDAKKYEKATGGKFGFESAANVEEKRKHEAPPIAEDDELQKQLCNIAIAATADKEHIQQMSNYSDDLLAVIKQQQEQISELMRQNGILISKLGGTDTAPATKAADKPIPAAPASLGRQTTYTAAEKALARATIKEINAGKTPDGRGMCVICKKHFGTARCFEIEANKAIRPKQWKSLFD